MKINSRRNKTRGAAAFSLFLILFINPRILFSQQLNTSAIIKEGKVTVKVRLDLEDYSNTLKTMQSGLKAEMLFEFRLYKKQYGIISLLGDRLVREEKTVYTGYYNMYDKYFILKENKGREIIFKDSNDFLENFFSLKDYVLKYPDRSNVNEYYLMYRIKYIPVKLVPPLNIVNIFTNSDNISTKWQRVMLEAK